MADKPSPPAHLHCPWCRFEIIINARGQRGRDEGSGVEAARLMQSHAARFHHRTWAEWIAAS